jgi:MinD superfamily P-loop ATPase
MALVKGNWPPIKVDSITICGKCGSNCKDMTAFVQSITPGYKAMKCENCGHSFIEAKIEITSKVDDEEVTMDGLVAADFPTSKI